MAVSLFYMGDLLKVNGTTDPYTMSAYLAKYDEVILKLPINIGLQGQLTFTIQQDFMSIIKMSGKKIWATIDLTPSLVLGSPRSAVSRAKNHMDFLYSEFMRFRMIEQLKGFYIQNFGYRETTYADGNIMNREQQNLIVRYAHIDRCLPVAVSAPYPSDLFVEIGPDNRSSPADKHRPVWHTMVGHNAVHNDLVIYFNPLISTAGFSQVSRILEAVHLFKHLTIDEMKNVKCLMAQEVAFELGNAPDQLIGLDLHGGVQVELYNHACFLNALGITNIAYGDTNFGTSTGNVIFPKYFEVPADYRHEGFGELFSQEGHYVVEYEQADGQNGRVRVHHEFDAHYTPIRRAVTPVT